MSSLMGIAQAAQDQKKTAPRPARTPKRQTVSEGRAKYQTGVAKPSLGGLLKGLVTAVTNEGGRCIRCKDPVSYDPDRPLCDDCFKSWKRYENWDFPEKFCHDYGEKWRTSYAKPLCGPCYD